MKPGCANFLAEPLEHVAALVTWYTKGGAFVKRASALIEYDPIMPGQKSPFSVETTDNPLMTTFTVEFKVMGRRQYPQGVQHE
jgi:hypothetical protein